MTDTKSNKVKPEGVAAKAEGNSKKAAPKAAQAKSKIVAKNKTAATASKAAGAAVKSNAKVEAPENKAAKAKSAAAKSEGAKVQTETANAKSTNMQQESKTNTAEGNFANAATGFDNSEHNKEVKKIFGSVARGYDFLNHTLSMGFDIYWRKVLVKSLAAVPEGYFLDLAAGTFDVSLALAKHYPARRIVAGDLSLPMLTQGLPKIEKAKNKNLAFAEIMPVTADAYNLPLPDSSVAAITVSFGLRNMVPRVPALTEMYRVLKPGGRLSVLEFGSAKPKVWFGLYNFYLANVLPRVGGLISGDRSSYEYLAKTIYDFPVAEELVAEINAAGFKKVKYRSLTGGIVYIHCADK